MFSSFTRDSTYLPPELPIKKRQNRSTADWSEAEKTNQSIIEERISSHFQTDQKMISRVTKPIWEKAAAFPLEDMLEQPDKPAKDPEQTSSKSKVKLRNSIELGIRSAPFRSCGPST